MCEVQIASVASHVFNEIEHDLVYKQDEPPSPDAQAGRDRVLRACRELDEAVERVGVAVTHATERT